MSSHDSHNENAHAHKPSYGIYILIWVALLILTGLTVAVAGINFGNLTVITALTVASVKSYLVLEYFMHLKHEKKMFWIFVYTSLFFLGVSLILLFADYTFLEGN